MKPFYFSVVMLSFCIVLITACKKSSGDNIQISGFRLLDVSGNFVGWQGAQDNDWTFNNTLTDRELSLFNFSTDVTLDNTVEATITGNGIVAYPNPFISQQLYHVIASDSVLLKLVVVDSHLQVLVKTAMKVKGSNSFAINYSDQSVYPDKSALRVYYSFSAQNKPNYKTGYGDIKICRQASNVDDCFR
jgi:hypothetical protein